MIVAIAASLLASGTPAPVCHGVGLPAAVARYAVLSRASDARRVAAMYAPDGVLVGPKGAPYTGPAEVERFLGGFGAYKLADYVMTIDASAPQGKKWRTEGGYRQTGADPSGAGFVASGRFTIEWACRRGGWRVVRLTTTPAG
ncbi:MAG: nuclear transport factor 2 family protein [Proteobacteria bacterium]|nr:nuclear transport factor 2 family protein [Pseudomonadota bacterium]